MTKILYALRGLADGAMRRRFSTHDEQAPTEAAYNAYIAAFRAAFRALHPLSSITPECKSRREERRYERAMEEMCRDHDEEVRTGYRVCPTCGERKVKVRFFPTRQYGGGFDSTEVCENAECSYREVFV